ncbi:MAG TPA: nitroreductase family deazaflavin-dependent oxidoreductase [Ktedonobacter sp.]|nr:nitroreductase family deazaflavin-dependent oxidoreductase [Ktedonobacter sp.]
MPINLDSLANENFCYLTTTGRRSGKPHTIEIWFALKGNTLYMLSGGRDKSDWVRNISQHPDVQVRIRESVFNGQARVVRADTDAQEDALARDIVYDKYTARGENDLIGWSHTSLPVAVDLAV